MSSDRGATTRTGGRAATTAVIPGRYGLSVGKPDLPAPDGWAWTRLADVARLETGHTPSRRHEEYWNGDIPWIGIQDATQNYGRTIQNTSQHVTELGIANSSARVLPAHTVCLSRTASVGYVVTMGRPMATSQDFVNWVCSEEIDSRFLKYVLLAERDSFLRFASGTTHQTIYFPEVKAFHVCLPPIDEQDRIAAVLGTLDDKINSNRRLAALLEETAATTFRARFVDFVGVEEFEETEIGAIPRGWQPGSLADLAEFVNGKAFTKDANGDGRPILRIKELKAGVSDATPWSDIEARDGHIARHHDILFAWSGSLDVYRWSGQEALINQHVFKVIPRGFPAWFVFGWIRQHMPEFQAIARDKATTMGHIQRRHLTEATVPIPDGEALAAACEELNPLDRQHSVLTREIRTLIEVRDAVLPKLVSGAIRVPGTADPDEAIGAVAEEIAG